MKDERMTQSEALYAFLTPTPEHLHQPSPQKKSKFLLVNLIKRFVLTLSFGQTYYIKKKYVQFISTC